MLWNILIQYTVRKRLKQWLEARHPKPRRPGIFSTANSHAVSEVNGKKAGPYCTVNCALRVRGVRPSLPDHRMSPFLGSSHREHVKSCER